MTKGEEACVSLKDHFDAVITQLEKRLVDADNSAKEAIKVANAAQEHRLNLLNEFRAQSSDEAKKYALRETVDALSRQVSTIWGGLVVVGLVGVANLVKLFFSR